MTLREVMNEIRDLLREPEWADLGRTEYAIIFTALVQARIALLAVA